MLATLGKLILKRALVNDSGEDSAIVQVSPKTELKVNITVSFKIKVL